MYENNNKIIENLKTNIESAIQDTITEAEIFNSLLAKNDNEYNRGIEECLSAVRKLMLLPEDGGLTTTEIEVIFGTGTRYDILRKYTAHEIITMIQAYIKRPKIGDEVICESSYDYDIVGEKMIVLAIDEDDEITCLCRDGRIMDTISTYSKTGKHYSTNITDLITELNLSNKKEN